MAKRKTKKMKSFLNATKSHKKKKLGALRNQKSKRRVDPLWTPEQGISYSLLTKFMCCRQRFHLSSVQGWKPKGINIALEFGNMFHLMTEAQDMGISLDQMPTIVNNYLKPRLEDPNSDEFKLRDLSMMAGVCIVTFQEYVKYWESHYSIEIKKGSTSVDVLENEFNWIAKEQAFKFEYKLPDGTKVNLVGKQDGEFSIKKLAKMGRWLFETKTKGDIDEYGITKGLHKDMQTGLYMTAMQHNNRAIPAGVLYNCIRRTRLKPRVKDTPIMFADRVREDIQKRPEFYFYRWSRLITEKELDEFQRYTLNPALFQVMQWWNSIKGNPMDPFSTPCKECGGTGQDMSYLADTSNKKAKDFCPACDGKGNVHNLLHFERPFGAYDGFQHSQRGEFFEIVTDNNFLPFEQKEHAFPELQDDDSVNHYLQDVEI